MKRIFLSILSVLAVFGASAQEVTFRVSAPNMVGAGEIFRIEFTVSAATGFSSTDITMGEIGGVDILAGPTKWIGEDVTIVNNSVSSMTKHAFTYVVQAKEVGRVTIPSASVNVNGRTHTTQPTLIDVASAEAMSQGGSARGNNAGSQQQATLAPDDIILRVQVSRTNVFRGEPIKVTYKLYTRVDIAAYEGFKIPAFNGFWAHEFNVDGYQWQRETYNDKVYDALVVKEYLLYPLQAGELLIEQMNVTVVARLVSQSRSQSLFDSFFGGGPTVRHEPKSLSTAPVRATVNELPAGAPASFNGAVGNFNIEIIAPPVNITANELATYSIRINGSGNMPLIQTPRFTLPASFEMYNSQKTETLNATPGGISGHLRFDYPFIARAEGEYSIEGFEFTYFNPELRRYVTVPAQTFILNVAPDASGRGSGGGMVSGLTREDVRILDSDIRFIRMGAPGRLSDGRMLVVSPLYWGVVLLLVVLYFVAAAYLKHRRRQMKNGAFIRGKRANRIALERLRAAEGFMRANDQRRFYEEMLKALWGYMSNKLNIPVANLTKESVREELTKRNVQEGITGGYINLITDCEYAQYSPDAGGHMGEVYNLAVRAISKIESAIKK